MFDLWRKRRVIRGAGVEFTLIDLMVVVAVIGVVAALALPLYANAEARDRIEKAQEDLQMLAAAVKAYAAHMGMLPAALTLLTSTATNRLNWSAGPFMPWIPRPPSGGTPAWGAAYTYTSSTAGTFSLTASGDGTTITVP
jgi:type II secretory pathway pseudopilin PulG